MANYNRIILAGNITRDPELSYTPSNAAVCKFGLAVNRQWTDKNTNEKHEETMFVDCKAWNRPAEIINQYCKKGSPILVEGRLVFESWTGQDGQKRSKHTVRVDAFQFLGGAGGQQSDTPAPERGAQQVPSGPPDDTPF